MSFTPTIKSTGDIIASNEWNTAMLTIQSLETNKVNKTGDTITGPLQVSGTAVLNFGTQVRQMLNLWSTEYAIGVQSWTQYYRSHRNFAWYKDGSHHDGELNPGGGTVQMVIQDGNVGIGTSSPQAKLQVSGGAIMPSAGNNEQSGILFPPNPGGGGSDRAWIRYYVRSGEATTFEIGTANDTDDHIALMPALGNVGIGTNTPTAKLHLATGTAIKPGGGSWGATSDVRLKQNVNTLKGGLEKLLQLRGVTFEWKEPEKQGNLTGTQMGMVAQEVEKVFPEWVGEASDGLKVLSIYGFEALVVEAIRELEARIKTLEAKKK
jgi:hypothetical protein